MKTVTCFKSLLVVFVLSLSYTQPAFCDRTSSEKGQKTALIPASISPPRGAVLVSADLKEPGKIKTASPTRQAAPKPAGPAQKRDELGRLVEEHTADYRKVFTYHADGYSVFEENKARGVYTISEFIHGKLFSTTTSSGEFTKYDGRQVSQRITADGNVFDYAYTKNPDGSPQTTIVLLNGKFHSKTTYLSKNSYREEFANGSVYLYRDGLLRYSKDARTGFEWNYAYLYDAKGKLDQKIATRLSDGFVVVTDLSGRNNKKDSGRNASVNFQKVQNAALNSVTQGPLEVKTNDGNRYQLVGGALKSMQRGTKAIYVYSDRVLSEIRYGNGLTVKADANGTYRRV